MPPAVLRHSRLGIAARGGRAPVFAATAATAPVETADHGKTYVPSGYLT